jgi:hypothetical protein
MAEHAGQRCNMSSVRIGEHGGVALAHIGRLPFRSARWFLKVAPRTSVVPMEILLFFHPAVTLAAAMPGGTGSEQQLQVNTPLGERCSYSGIIFLYL